MDLSAALFADLNECQYLYLREISEPSENAIRILVEEAIVGPDEKEMQVGGVTFSGLRAIESTENSRTFEITWPSYIAYSVRNESFTTKDEYEQVDFGKWVCAYSRSRSLDYLSAATFASREYPGEFRHIEIICLNHVVDVV